MLCYVMLCYVMLELFQQSISGRGSMDWPSLRDTTIESSNGSRSDDANELTNRLIGRRFSSLIAAETTLSGDERGEMSEWSNGYRWGANKFSLICPTDDERIANEDNFWQLEYLSWQPKMKTWKPAGPKIFFWKSSPATSEEHSEWFKVLKSNFQSKHHRIPCRSNLQKLLRPV